MSSARKRSAIQKANNEADLLRQRLMLAENHINILRTMAEAIGRAGDEMSKALSVIADGDGDAQVIAAQTLEKVGVRTTALVGSNVQDHRPCAPLAQGPRGSQS